MVDRQKPGTFLKTTNPVVNVTAYAIHLIVSHACYAANPTTENVWISRKIYFKKRKMEKTLLCVESAVVLNYPFLTVMTLIFSVPYMVRVDIHASDASGIVLITWPA